MKGFTFDRELASTVLTIQLPMLGSIKNHGNYTMHAEPRKKCTNKFAYKIYRRQMNTLYKALTTTTLGTEKRRDLKLAHAFASNPRKPRGDRETELNGEMEREAIS